jgi:hypothetical protein
MSRRNIRCGHLYLYDSTIGQDELARQNFAHTKLILKAKSKVNTESPKFWIPHVGSPLRLTRPHSAAVRPAKAKELDLLVQQQESLIHKEKERRLEVQREAAARQHGTPEQRKESPKGKNRVGRSRTPPERKPTNRPRAKEHQPPAPSTALGGSILTNDSELPIDPVQQLNDTAESGFTDNRPDSVGSGVSPFRARGTGPARTESPSKSRAQRRKHQQQLAFQRALEQEAAEEQRRKEEWIAAQERGKSTVTLTPDQVAKLNIPLEYGRPHQHLTYHAEEVLPSPQAEATRASALASVTSSAAASRLQASLQRSRNGNPFGEGDQGSRGPEVTSAVAQHIVEQFVDFCVNSFDHSQEGDSAYLRLMSHVAREVEERRLLANHRVGAGSRPNSAMGNRSF